LHFAYARRLHFWLEEQIQDLKVQKLEADLSLKDKEIQGKDKDIQELKAELARKKTNIWGARAGARTRAGGARGGCVQHLQGLRKKDLRNLLVGARLAVGGTNKAMMTRYLKNEEKPQVVPTDEQAEDLGEAPAAIPGETEADAEPKVDVPLTELPSPSRSWAPQTPPPFRTPCLPHGSASSDLQRQTNGKPLQHQPSRFTILEDQEA
jgi:hypothetical protein